MHHTGSQENEVEPEEQEETPEQELSGGPEPEGDLQECPDHRPSTFKRHYTTTPNHRQIADGKNYFYGWIIGR